MDSERCATCEAILDLAFTIARHWRDQSGVNASLLDQLAERVGNPSMWLPKGGSDGGVR